MPQVFSNSIIYSIPSFLHIYAFILLSTAVISANIITLRLICIFWLVVELLFEIGQQPSMTDSIIDILPDWFNHAIANYFIYGHFDMLDVSALILGVIAAYFTVVISLTRQQSN
ncbi:MAG: hypothetical protein OQL06_07875 [Gammaproteobacteria bacterium]|nr:hypothetical protein [Gammaproteobacteria bacterium]